MRYAVLVPGCAALLLAGCTDTYHVNAKIGSTSALLTTADLRAITERPVPSDPTNANRRAVCVEPSPDVAKALSTAAGLSAKANVPSGAGGEASLNAQAAEQLAELSGRIPGIIGLRDGTFQLCQAWANGAVGDSSYALALSRYGELLVTLILGDAVSASARNQPAKLTPVMLANNGGGGTDNTTPSKPATPPAAPATPKLGSANPAPNEPRVRLASLTWPALPVAAAEPVTPAKPPVASPAPAQPAATSPPAAKTTTTTVSASAATATSDAGAVAAAQALEHMQQNYLTLGVAAPLIVACIASGDETTPNYKQNKVLSPSLCRNFLVSYAQKIPTLLANSSAAARRTVSH